MNAIVRHNYEKEQDDELNLNVGEFLTDVRKVDEGWCEGTLNGITGMFPDNFVEILQPTQHPPELPKSRGISSKLRRAKVTYSYTADNDDELSLELGQIVEILDEEEEGWWKGRLHGVEGVFPSNFVEPIVEQLEEDNKSPEKKGRPPSMVAMPGLGGINPLELRNKLKPVIQNPNPPSPPISQGPPIHTTRPPGRSEQKAKVMFSYLADQEDEVTIKDGDIVDVLEQDTGQDGWWRIRAGDKEGLVPDNFLELITEQVTPPSKPPPVEPYNNPPLPPKSTNEVPTTVKPTLPGAKSVLPKLPSKVDIEEHNIDDIPRRELLDNSKAKDRPKRNAVRPPSQRNSNVDEPSDEITAQEQDEEKGRERTTSNSKAPWQEEIIKRKKLPAPTPVQPKPQPQSTRPKPSRTPKPVVPTPPSKPAVPTKDRSNSQRETRPPPTQPPPSTTQTPSSPVPSKSASTSNIPSKDERESPLTVTSGQWKESLDKLSEEFIKFQEEMKEEIRILVEDLDSERKKRAQLEVDVDRLKKLREFRDKV